MRAAAYQGVVKGQQVVLLDHPVPLAEGTKVLVTPLPPEPGTAPALLAALEAAPHVTREDGAELERAIAEGTHPRARVGPLLEDGAATEAGGIDVGRRGSAFSGFLVVYVVVAVLLFMWFWLVAGVMFWLLFILLVYLRSAGSPALRNESWKVALAIIAFILLTAIFAAVLDTNDRIERGIRPVRIEMQEP